MSSYNNFDVENFLKEFNVNAYRESGGSWEQLAKILEVAETLATNKNNETANKEKAVSSTYKAKDAPQATYNGAAATNSNNRKTEPAHTDYNYANELNKSIEHLNKRMEDYTKAVRALKASKANENNFIEHTNSSNSDDTKFTNSTLRKNVEIRNSNSTENSDKTVCSHAESAPAQNTISNLNNIKATTTSTNPESYELYSNEGIRMFLYDIRKRFPETLKFINSICEDSSAYHDLIFNVLTNEAINELVNTVEKSAIAYNKLIENHGVEIVRKIISRPSDFSFLFG